MLGEKIGQEQGKVTGMRVLPGDDFRYVKMEITFQGSGTMCGQPVTSVGTYTVFERVPGQLYGEGQGVIETADGQGAIWKGHGVGKPTGRGMGMKFAASVAFQAPPTGPLSRLNGVLCVLEHEADENGNATTASWEWKNG